MRRLFSAYVDLKEASAEKSEKYAFSTVQKFAFDFDRGFVEGSDFPEYKDLMTFYEIESLLGHEAKPEPQLLRQRELLFFKAIFRHIQTKVDPTGGKYTLWIIKRYASGLLGAWEDMGRVKEALEGYRLLHTKRWWNKSVEAKEVTAAHMSEINGIGGTRFSAMHVDAYRNIDHINSLTNLELFVKASGIQDFVVAGAYEKHKGKGFRVIYEGEEGYVIELKTVEASVDLFRGPTSWCTARPNNAYFDEYTSQGPLYVLYDKAKKYYLQWHDALAAYRPDFKGLETDAQYIGMSNIIQVMDARDNRVTIEKFESLDGKLTAALRKVLKLNQYHTKIILEDDGDFTDWLWRRASIEDLKSMLHDELIAIILAAQTDPPLTIEYVLKTRKADIRFKET